MNKVLSAESAAALSFTELYSEFKLIVKLQMSLLWFTLSALLALCSAEASCFQLYKSTVHHLLSSKQQTGTVSW